VVFIVETGAGTPNANAYTTPAFVTTYLNDKGREDDNDWSTRSLLRQQQAIVEVTEYIDFRHGARVKGERRQQLIEGRQSLGTVTIAVLPLINELLTVGQIPYRFVDALTQENDVLRGATTTASAANVIEAINNGGNGTSVHLLTQANYEAEATSLGAVVTVEGQIDGASGNDIVFTTTVTSAVISGSGTLTGGIDEGPQPLIFPRRGLRGYDGRLVIGIPLKLKQATAEYATRTLAAKLAPDLTVDTTGALVQRKREKVGPIEEETEYAQGAVPDILRDYPAADRLLQEYLRSGGGVVR